MKLDAQMKEAAREAKAKQRAEQTDRIADIEKKAVKLFKALNVMENLNINSPAVKEVIVILNKELVTLENVSAQMVKQRFMDLKKKNAS
jgi:HD superfamily phosphodiesterase